MVAGVMHPTCNDLVMSVPAITDKGMALVGMRLRAFHLLEKGRCQIFVA
jgi:hypothetical protein